MIFKAKLPIIIVLIDYFKGVETACNEENKPNIVNLIDILLELNYCFGIVKLIISPTLI